MHFPHPHRGWPLMLNVADNLTSLLWRKSIPLSALGSSKEAEHEKNRPAESKKCAEKKRCCCEQSFHSFPMNPMQPIQISCNTSELQLKTSAVVGHTMAFRCRKALCHFYFFSEGGDGKKKDAKIHKPPFL